MARPCPWMEGCLQCGDVVPATRLRQGFAGVSSRAAEAERRRQAGTHSHRRWLDGRYWPSALLIDHAVWVPACAGTTPGRHQHKFETAMPVGIRCPFLVLDVGLIRCSA